MTSDCQLAVSQDSASGKIVDALQQPAETPEKIVVDINSPYEVQAALASFSLDRKRLYIDAVFDPQILAQQERQELFDIFFSRNRPEYHLLFQSTPFEHLLQLSPFLWRAPGQNDTGFSFLANLLSMTRKGPRFCFFAATSASFNEAVLHWRSLLEAELPNGHLTHLRSYNGGIMSHLFAASAQSERSRLLGPYVALLATAYPEFRQPEVDMDGEAVSEHELSAPRWLRWRRPGLQEPDPDAVLSLWRQEIKNCQEAPHLSQIARSKSCLPPFVFSEHHLNAFGDAREKIAQHNFIQRLWNENPAATLRLCARCEHMDQSDANEASSAMPDEEKALKKFVNAAWREGKRYGFTGPDLEKYAYLLARNYDNPNVLRRQGEIMRSPGRTPLEKLSELERIAEDRLSVFAS